MRIQFPRLIADYRDFQPVPNLELSDQSDHLGIWLRLREHEPPKRRRGEGPLLVEYHPIEIFFERQLSLLVGIEGQVMPLLHFGKLEPEIHGRSPACLVVPSVGEQDAANIQKQRRDWECSFHHRCQSIRDDSSGTAAPEC